MVLQTDPDPRTQPAGGSGPGVPHLAIDEQPALVIVDVDRDVDPVVAAVHLGHACRMTLADLRRHLQDPWHRTYNAAVVGEREKTIVAAEHEPQQGERANQQPDAHWRAERLFRHGTDPSWIDRRIESQVQDAIVEAAAQPERPERSQYSRGCRSI